MTLLIIIIVLVLAALVAIAAAKSRRSASASSGALPYQSANILFSAAERSFLGVFPEFDVRHVDVDFDF
jgi:hypothetical protein